MQHNHQSSKPKMMLGFLIGAAVGAAGVYLLGTKKGKQTLDTAIKHLESYEGKLEKKVKHLKDQAMDMTEPIQKKAQEVKTFVKDTIDAVRSSDEPV